MQTRRYSTLAFLAVLAGLTALYWGGVAGTPFHPDESSYIYMSAEVEQLAANPADLAWQPGRADDIRQRYRLLNPALTHYVTGLARVMAGLPPTPVDWDWSKNWEENRQAGALPGENLLLAARWGMAALYPFSVLLIFLAGRRMGGEVTAWAGALLLGTNALVLLHTRRAMAEGALLFTLCLALWVMLKAEKRPWLAGIPAGLAFCAKHSLAALAPVGLLAVLWNPRIWEVGLPWRRRLGRALGQAALYGVLYAGVVILLNPVLWRYPVQALAAAGRLRSDLAAQQAADRPGQALDTPGRRLVGMLGSVYLTPPVFAETGNYLAETAPAEAAYLDHPFNHLLRSLPAGGLLLALGLFGSLSAALSLRREPEHRRERALALAATLCMAAGLYATLPFPWQRYYLPLVPFACLWAGYGIKAVISGFARRKSPPGKNDQQGSSQTAHPRGGA